MKTRPLSDEDKKLTAKKFAEKYAGHKMSAAAEGEIFTVCAYNTSRAEGKAISGDSVVLGRDRRSLDDMKDSYTFVIPTASHGIFVREDCFLLIEEEDHAQALLDKYAGKRLRVARAAITNSGCPSNAEKDEEFTILIKEKKNENEVLTEFCNNKAMGHGPFQNQWFVQAKDIEENIIGVLTSSDDL